MNEIKLPKLSKIISHALRHKPSLYNLELDNDGWVKIKDLIHSLKELDNNYKKLSKFQTTAPCMNSANFSCIYNRTSE